MKKYQYFVLSVFACSIFFSMLLSCMKDKVPVLTEPELTKYEIISGDYKVYDTMGIFLYNMNLDYLDGPIIGGFKRDSIYFTNFDGEFDFRSYQGNSNSELHVQVGIHDTLFDTFGKRWKLLLTPYYAEKNTLINDTMIIEFRKTNINYWIEDAVPFEECYCKQIAVKQY